MVRFFFILVCGFLLGAVIIENKQYFSNKVSVPVAFLPDGGIYDGTLLKGELNGLGRIVWPNGNVYEGEFKEGLFHGIGRYETADFIYKGEFNEGVAIGTGVIQFINGDIYEGDVVDGKAEGDGSFVSAEAEYVGEFQNNVFHGKGKLAYKNGDIYEGDFVTGEFSGKGVFTGVDGKIFQGDFSRGAMNGKGDYRDGEISYTGDFVDWLFNGRGVYDDQQGSYEGDFANGVFDGVGTYSGADGVSYKGGFKEGRYHGQGILEIDGERYEGGFEYGMLHGEGTLTYAKPLDGISRIKGVWQYGQLQQSDNPLAEYNSTVIVEDALYQQKDRLEGLIDSIEENDPELTELYFVGVAGDGSQGVFRREVNFVRDLFDRDFGTRNKSSVLINGNVSFREVPLATTTSIEALLQGVAQKMDPEQDILFVYFTSHGSRDFQFYLSQQGLQLQSLSAERMGTIIRSLPVRYKVVVISACFSGGFVKSVKDDNTMVIVAAAADKQSFGCSDTAEMTYFGEAFFKDALPLSDSFAAAFDRARHIVRGREAKEGFEHSDPLIFKPEAIRTQLVRWREDLDQWQQQQNKIID